MNKVHIREGHLRLGPGICASFPNPDCVPATAYLAGPMRGLPYFNFPAFDDAAEKLRVRGWTIHSPAEKDRDVLDIDLCPDGTDEELAQQNFSLAGALLWDFQRIQESSCVICLPGWETSTGVHWELTVAHALGKPVFQYPELTPVELPDVVTDPVGSSKRVGSKAQRARFSAEQADYAHMRGVDGPGAYARVAASVPGDGHLTHSHPEQPEPHVHEHPLAGGVRVERPDAFDKALIWDDIAGGKLGEVRVVDPTTGGAKGSKGIPWSLLPWGVLRELAKHYQRGCQKYSARNWEAGYKWSLSHDSLLNHLTAFWGGDDIDHDPTVGDFPHVIAVVWHACALAYFWLKGKGTDDRPT